MAAVLELRGVVSGYHKKQVLHGVNVRVDEGEIVAMVGHNGAGKTTLLRSIFGLVRIFSGEIVFEGHRITNRKPSLNVRDGISFVPGHSIFGDLTVLENLRMGAYTIDWTHTDLDSDVRKRIDSERARWQHPWLAAAKAYADKIEELTGLLREYERDRSA